MSLDDEIAPVSSRTTGAPPEGAAQGSVWGEVKRVVRRGAERFWFCEHTFCPLFAKKLCMKK